MNGKGLNVENTQDQAVAEARAEFVRLLQEYGATARLAAAHPAELEQDDYDDYRLALATVYERQGYAEAAARLRASLFLDSSLAKMQGASGGGCVET